MKRDGEAVLPHAPRLTLVLNKPEPGKYRVNLAITPAEHNVMPSEP